MRKAAKKINDLVQRFEQDYAVSDKQDVLAMCALQFASALEIKNIDDNEAVNEATNRLVDLHSLLVDKLK
jgi:cell division protein ZapA